MNIDEMAWQNLVATVLADNAAPFWIKGQINTILEKDALDADKYVEILHVIARKRVIEAFGNKKKA